MNITWEPGIAQAMQRHGGSNHSVPKVSAPKLQPEARSSEQPMATQDAPLVPAAPLTDDKI